QSFADLHGVAHLRFCPSKHSEGCAARRSCRIDPFTSWRLDAGMLPWYQGNMKAIHRTQTGVRLETRVLKVSKALADLLDMSLGDLIEGVLLHAFEGKAPFSPQTL